MKIKPFRCKTCGAPIGWNDKGCDGCGHLVAFDTEKHRIVIGGIVVIMIIAVAFVLLWR